MATDAEKIRAHLDNNRLNEALTLSRRLARATQMDMRVRALLLEVLYAKGEHGAVATELAAIERELPTGHAELQRLRARFKKRG